MLKNILSQTWRRGAHVLQDGNRSAAIYACQSRFHSGQILSSSRSFFGVEDFVDEDNSRHHLFSGGADEVCEKVESKGRTTYNEEVLLPGGHGLMIRGYRPVINTLAKGLDIRLGHRVVEIVHHRNRVEVTVSSDRTFVADAAVVAVPLGVLKANTIKFEPRLPKWKEEAIRELSLGVENKIVLHFITGTLKGYDQLLNLVLDEAIESEREQDDPLKLSEKTSQLGLIGNPFWKLVRNLLKAPGKEQVECQAPKPILLDTGEMKEPYDWAPAILPIQIIRIGQLVILCVPGEFTTMAGRRLRDAVKNVLTSGSNGKFNNNIHVLLAGLTNTYSQYVTTFEEYQIQRYEGASPGDPSQRNMRTFLYLH